jgi:lipoprotein-anchoring transpeptidase ErfK/SrfK
MKVKHTIRTGMGLALGLWGVAGVQAQPAPNAPPPVKPAIAPNGQQQGSGPTAAAPQTVPSQPAPSGNHSVAPQRASLPGTAQRINAASLPAYLPAGRFNAAVLRAQILLDRAHFSPGQIDGYYAANMAKAIAGFQNRMHLPTTGNLDSATWRALTQQDRAPALGAYTISSADTAGPFVRRVPAKMAAQAGLPCTCYTSPLEELGEKYHVNPKLLKKLNPGAHFGRAGTTIVVPLVHNAPPAKRIAKVVVTAHTKTVTALDADGRIVAQYPATIGSSHDPLPIGDWKIKGVAKHPNYHYDPVHFWDANPNDSKTVVPPGPNNPVGVVWIQLTDPHYGIHGTPEPARIGKSYSHGCIRLTNWDAWELSKMVHYHVPALLQR